MVAEPFLGGYREKFGETLLEEITDVAIVSIACPLGGEDDLGFAVSGAWGVSLPEPGQASSAKREDLILFGMSSDQFFCVFPESDQLPATRIASAIGSAGYVTDQSDNWVALQLSGSLATTALERICPIDLELTVFPVGGVARTLMEHLGAVVYRIDEDSFFLLSASSSARSFLHAVETSIRNVM